MRYSLFVIFLIALSSNSFSQSFSSSPYSRFGIGDFATNSYQPGVAMGGTALALRSNHFVNIANPASNTAFDSLSFIFDVSVVNKNVKYLTKYQTSVDNNTAINHFSVGFPVSKHWFSSISLAPYSNVGYNITENLTIDTFNLLNTYKGAGGLNQFVIGNAIKVFTLSDTVKKDNIQKVYYNTKQLSIGVNSSFVFGALERNTSSVFPDESYLFDLYSNNKTIVNDFAFKFGLQYLFNKQEIINSEKTNKYSIITGITFDNKNDLSAKNTSLVTKYLNSNGSVTIDTIENKVNKKGTITIPINFGVGLSYINKDNFTLSLEYKWQQWSAARFFGTNDSLNNSQAIAAGIQYIPNNGRHNKYFNIINYRIGAHFTNTYLSIKGNKINEQGISFGFGFPIKKLDKNDVSMIRKKLPPVINIAVEFGKRGAITNDLIKENYIQVSLNLSLYDIWFVKRKFY